MWRERAGEKEEERDVRKGGERKEEGREGEERMRWIERDERTLTEQVWSEG